MNTQVRLHCRQQHDILCSPTTMQFYVSIATQHFYILDSCVWHNNTKGTHCFVLVAVVSIFLYCSQ